MKEHQCIDEAGRSVGRDVKEEPEHNRNVTDEEVEAMFEELWVRR